MRKALKIFLIILLIPVYLIGFAVIHELGHTLLARLLGDPDSVFYLARIEGDNACLGCNINDPSKLSWGSNLVVSLGGLGATQVVAIAALFLLRLPNLHRYARRLFGFISLGFMFLDVLVQVFQGLLYNLDTHLFPTNIDLVDAMLLVQERTGAGQILMKGILLTITIIYISAFLSLYWLNRWAHKRKLAIDVEIS